MRPLRIHYAAYGSNLHPVRLQRRIASARLKTIGFLPDWSLRFHKRGRDESGKCNIHRGGDGIHVAIFEISARDKRTLDGIEGAGVGYSEIELQVPGIGGCLSYAANDSHIDDDLSPYDWYRELVLEGARYHAFPDTYLKRIETTLAIGDPDGGRRLREWETVHHVRAGRV